ncbi:MULTISPECIES: hypothetical protein [unclassified Marinovum]
MLDMFMLLGTGLAAAGIAGMTGIGTQPVEADSAELSHSEQDEYQLGDDYQGGEGEDLLSQVRRMGEALTAASFQSLGGGGADAPSETESAEFAAEDAGDDWELPEQFDEVELTDETPVDALDMADEQAEAALDLEVEGTDAAADEAVQPVVSAGDASEADETQSIMASVAQMVGDTEADGALETDGKDGAEELTLAQADEGDEGNAVLAFEDDEDEIPTITDFAAGEEQLLLLLPEGMSSDTAIRIEPTGATGADAAVVLEDEMGSLTAAVIMGGYGTVSASDIALERDA